VWLITGKRKRSIEIDASTKNTAVLHSLPGRWMGFFSASRTVILGNSRCLEGLPPWSLGRVYRRNVTRRKVMSCQPLKAIPAVLRRRHLPPDFSEAVSEIASEQDDDAAEVYSAREIRGIVVLTHRHAPDILQLCQWPQYSKAVMRSACEKSIAQGIIEAALKQQFAPRPIHRAYKPGSAALILLGASECGAVQRSARNASRGHL